MRRLLGTLYNPRIAVPDFQNYIDRWYDSSLKFKKNLGKSIEIEMDVPYGDSIVETMDILNQKIRWFNWL